MKPYKNDWHGASSVLLVSGDKEDHSRLQRLLAATNWRLRNAETYSQALAVLQRDRPAILLCEASLPDGNWKDMLSQIAPIPDAPLLIVISGHPDGRLWSEVLNLGGHDVLSKPLESDEVLRALGLASHPAALVMAATD